LQSSQAVTMADLVRRALDAMVESICGDKDVVLVVDDDEMIVEIIDWMVERGGCLHASFNDPAEALQYYIGNSQKITLMITDLTMPVLPGPDLIRRALQINPKLPIVLMTNYAGEHIPDDVRSLVHRVLPKPFMKAEVLDAVRTGLNKVDH
jgi:two-component system, cell cycle sensor histidine kinase and response regulator CckA